MKLVGATPGGQVKYFVFDIPWEISPSIELRELLKSLPAGSEVGLETTENGIKPSGEGDSILSWQGMPEYWNPLKELCQERGLKIVYLDDPEFYKPIADKQPEIADLVNTEKELIEAKGRGENIEDKFRELNTQKKKMAVEVQFFQEYQKGQKILERVVQNPQMKVAIVSCGHSDYWMHHNLLEVESYMHDLPRDKVNHFDVDHALEYKTPIHQIADLQENPRLDLNPIAHLERVKRLYSALKTGRIFPNRRPDFIGTWDTQLPFNGLFEVYIYGRANDGCSESIAGEIEDVNGRAVFNFGKIIGGNYIEFAKFYDDMAIAAGGVKGEIFYNARLIDGEFQGRFRCRNPEYGDYNESFTMKDFSKK